jgi:hypothetical protein
MFTNVSCQQPRRPQFVRIAEILGFAAGKIDNESPRFFGDDPLTSRTGTVVESCHDAKPFCPPQASLDRLMRNADGSTHRVKRRCFAIGKEHPRPFDPARWFRPRARKPSQLRYILLCETQLDNSTSSRHDPIRLVQQMTEQEYKPRAAPMESFAYERIQGIDVLGAALRKLGFTRQRRRSGDAALALCGIPAVSCSLAHRSSSNQIFRVKR